MSRLPQKKVTNDSQYYDTLKFGTWVNCCLHQLSNKLHTKVIVLSLMEIVNVFTPLMNWILWISLNLSLSSNSLGIKTQFLWRIYIHSLLYRPLIGSVSFEIFLPLLFLCKVVPNFLQFCHWAFDMTYYQPPFSLWAATTSILNTCSGI